MALEINLVASAGRVGAAEEVVEADLVERRRGGEGSDVAAESAVVDVGADDHCHRVPAHVALDAAFDLAVPGEKRLPVRRNRVDVGRVGSERNLDTVSYRLVLQLSQEEPG